MITGYGEVMRDLPGENTPENIQIIIDEATRLSTLVNDLLDLSKLQSGALCAEKKEFCLTDSVSAIFGRYSKLIEQDGYNIVFNCREDVYINADELRISQVLYNLVNNAVNHAGEDKTVIVTQTVAVYLGQILQGRQGTQARRDRLGTRTLHSQEHPRRAQRPFRREKHHRQGKHLLVRA